MKPISRIIGAWSGGVALVCVALSGCGSSLTDKQAVGGSVADAPANASIALRDATGATRTTTTNANGQFAIDVSGLTPPFVLKAEWQTQRQYAVAPRAGATGVNSYTHTVAAGSAGGNADDAWTSTISVDMIEGFLSKLATVLKPLFDLYGISPASDDDLDDSAGFQAMLKAVSFSVSKGVLTVTNKATGGVIFTGPLKNLASGTFNAANLPGGTGITPPPPPPPSTCTYTYSAWSACMNGTQTRTVVSSSPAGCTGTPVLSQSCTTTPPPPSTCTYTYSAWGTCQPDATQTRTVISSTPAGCTGTPVLSQACTLDGLALYNQYCYGCHANAKKGSSAALITSAIHGIPAMMATPALQTLTPQQIQAISLAP